MGVAEIFDEWLRSCILDGKCNEGNMMMTIVLTDPCCGTMAGLLLLAVRDVHRQVCLLILSSVFGHFADSRFEKDHRGATPV